jgi:hypothetical protein
MHGELGMYVKGVVVGAAGFARWQWRRVKDNVRQ